jgi:hypothetical protein
VIGGGGTPIRIDNNQAIPGAATREQAENIRTVNKNSVMYNQYKDPNEIKAKTDNLSREWDRLSRAAIDPDATPEQREAAQKQLNSVEEEMNWYGQQSEEATKGLTDAKGAYEPGLNEYRTGVDATTKQRADDAAAAEANKTRTTASTNTVGEALTKLDQMFTTRAHGEDIEPGDLRHYDDNMVNRRVNEITELVGTLGDGSLRAFGLQARVVELLQDIKNSDDPNLVRRRYHEVKNVLGELGALGSASGTVPPTAEGAVSSSSSGLTPTGASQQSLTSVDGQQPTTQSGTVTNPSEPMDVSGVPVSRHDATTKPGRDQHGDPKYNKVISGMSANDVAEVFNIPPDQALYYLNNGAVFRPNGTMSVGGNEYDGSEVTDATTANGDAENAQAGQALYAGWTASVETENNRIRAGAGKELTDLAKTGVEKQLNTPLDLTAVTRGFDRTLDAQRQSAARNKALALRGIQERGAYSGASVNQMMGSSTEAGYGYDTEAQAQETMLNLQKEMAIVNATKEDAARKLNWATMLYNSAKTSEDLDRARILMNEHSEVLRQQGIREQQIQNEANKPSLGMTLAKVGIGVGGAVLAPFTGGSSLLVAGALGAGLQGAESAGMFGGGADAYSAYNRANPAPGSVPSSSSNFTYGTTGYAPGSRLNLGVPQLQLGLTN